MQRPLAFPVTCFLPAGLLACGPGGSNVPWRAETQCCGAAPKRFVNMAHLPMKLLRRKIEKRNLKLRQRNLKLQGEMREARGPRLLREATHGPWAPRRLRCGAGRVPSSTCACGAWKGGPESVRAGAHSPVGSRLP